MTMYGTNERAGQAQDIRPQPRWARSPNVLDRPTRQGVMVLPPEGAAVLLTGPAARVWEALAQPLDRDQLADRLARLAGGKAGGPGLPGVPAGGFGGSGGPAGGSGGDADVADQVAAVLGDLRAIGAVREIR